MIACARGIVLPGAQFGEIPITGDPRVSKGVGARGPPLLGTVRVLLHAASGIGQRADRFNWTLVAHRGSTSRGSPYGALAAIGAYIGIAPCGALGMLPTCRPVDTWRRESLHREAGATNLIRCI